MLNYMSIKDMAAKWGISERRIQKLCEDNRLAGVIRFGRSWAIPVDTEKPIDARSKKARRGKNESSNC